MRNPPCPSCASPPRLRPHAGGLDRIEAAGATVGEILDQLATQYPALRERLYDGAELRRFVNVYVNNEDIRYLDDLATPGRRGRRGQHHPGRRGRLKLT